MVCRFGTGDAVIYNGQTAVVIDSNSTNDDCLVTIQLLEDETILYDIDEKELSAI